MTTSNNPEHTLESITFSEDSLAYAFAAVRCYDDLAPELIAREVFQHLVKLSWNGAKTSPTTVWLSRSGGYTSKLEAVRNGEQQIAPVYIAWGRSR